MSVATFCARCGTRLDDDAIDPCESEAPSGMARFVASFCSSLRRGRSLDEAAAEAAPIARTTVEA